MNVLRIEVQQKLNNSQTFSLLGTRGHVKDMRHDAKNQEHGRQPTCQDRQETHPKAKDTRAC